MKHDEITKIRLHSWKQRLAEQKATPVILLGVAIEGKNTGQITILCTEERTDEEVRLFLSHVLRQLTPS